MKRNQQNELPEVGQVFNLHGECGLDPERVLRERLAAERAEAERQAYTARCQLTLEKCPGFIGCDAPRGPGLAGRIVVEPGHVEAAVAFLKRRFQVNERMDLEAGQGLCLELISRRQASRGMRSVKVSFAKPVQFELAL